MEIVLSVFAVLAAASCSLYLLSQRRGKGRKASLSANATAPKPAHKNEPQAHEGRAHPRQRSN